MQKISLREITGANIRNIFDLRVSEAQKAFICPNSETIAYCYLWPAKRPLAIYLDEEVIGLAAYEKEEEPGVYDILTMMLDERYQGLGLGKKAFEVLLDLLKSKPDCRLITLNFKPDNSRAEKFYQSFGFQRTGERFNDEIVMACNV